MRSRFREYRHRIVQNSRRTPLGTVTNSDQYRDEKGRFSTASKATEEAISATMKSGLATSFPTGMAGLRQGGRTGGNRLSHMNTANIHSAIAQGHDEAAQEADGGTEGRKSHLEAARLHNIAATAHWEAHSLLAGVGGAPNSGFDLSDNDQRRIYADWLDENGHERLAHRLRVYSS